MKKLFVTLAMALSLVGCCFEDTTVGPHYYACPAEPFERLPTPDLPAFEESPVPLADEPVICDQTVGCSMVASTPSGEIWNCSGTKLCEYYASISVSSANITMLCSF